MATKKKKESKKEEKRQEEQKLASVWSMKFKDAMIQKNDYTKKWLTYLDAYNGEYFKNKKLPEYRSDMVSNYIFSIVETIRPIMLDNKPKFQAMPRQPDGMNFSNDVNQALLYEWDREKMTKKVARELINTLVLGNSVFFVPWDSKEKQVKGTPVSPFNIFPDPLATCLDDAEYIIYASYKNVERLKRKFPDKIDDLVGGQIKYSELVQDNDKDAKVDNQVLVLEVWTTGYIIPEEEYDEDEKEKKKEKYKNGRVLTICPELNIVLDDKPNPYKDKKFPFEIIKDYDVPGKFWGEGEVSQLISPQKHINDMNNAIIDNAKATANMPWIVDKNAGIGEGKITARPGLIIRKNPGSEVRREQPPNMPQYVSQSLDVYKMDIQQISGVHDTLKGDSATGVYTAQGILALQEAGQSRIRLKVKLLEESLSRIGNMWFSRMKQFWKEDRWISIAQIDGDYDLKKFTKRVLDYDYDIRITAGSTLPVNRGAMLDLMIRLAQTQMPDGQALVDREAVVEYLPEEVKAPLMRRMQEENQNLAELQQAVEEISHHVEEVQQVSNQHDEEQFNVLEDMTNTIEDLNNQILQLREEYDKLEQEKQEMEKEQQIKDQSYNEGYKDAESLQESEMQPFPDDEEELLPDPLEGMGIEDLAGAGDIPIEVLEGLEALTDEELSLLLDKHPELMDLI